MWTTQEVRLALASKPVLVALTAQVSAVGGALAAYSILTRSLEEKYRVIAEEEIADAKRFYARLHKKDEFSDPVSALEQYAGKVEELEYVSQEGVMGVSVKEETPEVEEKIEEALEVVEEAAEEVKSIFDNDADDDFDYEAEVRMRNSDRPYLITEAEFEENPEEYEQSTLTYYEGDDVLTDSRDKPIPDPDMIAGDDNLLRFGVGTDDPNRVHVRNDKLKMDFEILKSTGKFTTEVLGFIEHSRDDRRPRKFRLGRDE